MGRYSGMSASGRDNTPFPTRQMAVLGTTTRVPGIVISTNDSSTMQNMRANCLHVHLPVRILHDPGLRHRKGRERTLHVRGHDHVVLCVRRMHQRNFLGPSQRSDWTEASAARRPLWHRTQHDTVWFRKKSTNGNGRSGSRRFAQWVRSSHRLASEQLLTEYAGTSACSKPQLQSWSQTRSTSVSSP
jgi:hypothetical protein